MISFTVDLPELFFFQVHLFMLFPIRPFRNLSFERFSYYHSIQLFSSQSSILNLAQTQKAMPTEWLALAARHELQTKERYNSLHFINMWSHMNVEMFYLHGAVR